MLLAEDGTRVAAEHLTPAPHADAGHLAVVLAHGLTMSSRHPAVRRIAAWLRDSVGVVLLDLRGHGDSAGRSTVGWHEVLDVDAAVRWARVLGYDRVATLGFSLGSAVVLRQAALLGGVDAVVSVSGPARWYYRGTKPMRLLHYAILTRPGRAVLRTLRGTTITPHNWTEPYPLNPSEAAAQITVPLLVIHGDQDHYFPVEHAMRVHEVAPPPKDLWVLEGFGHAEQAVDAALTGRITGWLAGLVAGDGDATVIGTGSVSSAPSAPPIVEGGVERGVDGEAIWVR